LNRDGVIGAHLQLDPRRFEPAIGDKTMASSLLAFHAVTPHVAVVFHFNQEDEDPIRPSNSTKDAVEIVNGAPPWAPTTSGAVEQFDRHAANRGALPEREEEHETTGSAALRTAQVARPIRTS
jgi:hypothetical protein